MGKCLLYHQSSMPVSNRPLLVGSQVCYPLDTNEAKKSRNQIRKGPIVRVGESFSLRISPAALKYRHFYAPALHCRNAPWLYPMVHSSPNIPIHAGNCAREQTLADIAGFCFCYDRIVRMSCAQHDNIHPFARDKKISVCFPIAHHKKWYNKITEQALSDSYTTTEPVGCQ